MLEVNFGIGMNFKPLLRRFFSELENVYLEKLKIELKLKVKILEEDLLKCKSLKSSKLIIISSFLKVHLFLVLNFRMDFLCFLFGLFLVLRYVSHS